MINVSIMLDQLSKHNPIKIGQLKPTTTYIYTVENQINFHMDKGGSSQLGVPSPHPPKIPTKDSLASKNCYCHVDGVCRNNKLSIVEKPKAIKNPNKNNVCICSTSGPRNQNGWQLMCLVWTTLPLSYNVDLMFVPSCTFSFLSLLS